MSGYRLINDEEPSESELAQIMHEVAVEARRKADEAQGRLDSLIAAQVQEVMAKMKLMTDEA